MGCDYNQNITYQPVPTIYHKNKNFSGDFKIAIRIYENDKSKPLYLQWDIDSNDEYINYELFKNNNTIINENINDFERKFMTNKYQKYNTNKNNLSCREVNKYTFEKTSNITLLNLPKSISNADEMIFESLEFDENTYISDSYYLIFNKIKEVWQLWKNQGNFVYIWIGEQKSNNSLFLEDNFWLFSPNYDDFGIFKFVNLSLYPSWYDRNKDISNLNIYKSQDQKISLENTDLFEKKINFKNSNSKKEIYDCNLQKNISEKINELVDIHFTNTLFKFNELKIDDNNTCFDFNNGKAYLNKKLKLELIPYNDITSENKTILSNKVKDKYINEELILELQELFYSSGENIVSNIKNDVLINRGNLDILDYYTDQSNKNLIEKINILKTKYYSEEDEEGGMDERIPVILENENIDIIKDFEDIVIANKIEIKNYTSYGDVGIYQNESLLNYKIPCLNNKNNLCPFFESYLNKTNILNGNVFVHKINIVKIINYCKIILLIFSTFLLSLGIGIDELYNNYPEIETKYRGDKFDLNKFTNNELENLSSYELIKKYNTIISNIEFFKIKEIELIHKYIILPPSFSDNVPSDGILESSNNVENNAEEQNNAEENFQLENEPAISISFLENKDIYSKVKFLRDIYLIHYYSNIIYKNIIIDIDKIVAYNNNNELIIKILNSILLEFYRICTNKYDIYFQNKGELENEIKNINTNIVSMKIDSIDNEISKVINNYKIMSYNILGL